GDDLAEVHHEFVAAVGDDEGDAKVAGPGQERGREVAAEIQHADRLGHLLGGDRADPRATIEHAVDGGQRHAGLAGDVVHGRPPRIIFVWHACPRTWWRELMSARRRRVNHFWQIAPRGVCDGGGNGVITLPSQQRGDEWRSQSRSSVSSRASGWISSPSGPIPGWRSTSSTTASPCGTGGCRSPTGCARWCSASRISRPTNRTPRISARWPDGWPTASAVPGSAWREWRTGRSP